MALENLALLGVKVLRLNLFITYMKHTPTYKVLSRPATVSWKMAEDTRHQGHRQRTLLLVQ